MSMFAQNPIRNILLAAALFASLSKAVLPVFVERLDREGDAAFRGVSGVVNVTFVVLVLFALPSMPWLRRRFARRVPEETGESSRKETGPRIDTRSMATALAIAAIFIGLILWQLRDVRLGLYFVGGIIGFLILTAGVVQGVLLLLRKVRFKRLVLRQAVNELLGTAAGS